VMGMVAKPALHSVLAASAPDSAQATRTVPVMARKTFIRRCPKFYQGSRHSAMAFDSELFSMVNPVTLPAGGSKGILPPGRMDRDAS